MKLEILRLLARVPDAPASEIAASLNTTMPAASMALLRLTRSGLVERAQDQQRHRFFYSITPKGLTRLHFFEGER